jgi:putative ABC transport system substrate-binding protein
VPLVEGFRQGLGATGFVEGRTIGIEYRWADNQLDRLPALANELVARRVALIVAGSATAAALVRTNFPKTPIRHPRQPSSPVA